MKELDGWVALLTGAAGEIGWATAELLCQKGARVVLVDKSEEALLRLQEKLGDSALSCVADVSSSEEVEGVVQRTLEHFQEIHIFVHCAGIIRPAMFHKMEQRQWEEVLQVHLTGGFLASQAVARHWIQIAKEQGRFSTPRKMLFLSSIAGVRGTIGQANYAAAKAGLLGLTMAAARELGKYNICVNALALGVIETKMSEKIRTDPKLRNYYLNQIVLERFGTLQEAAEAILFFCSPASNYVTGQVLVVDGGLHIGL